MKTPLQRRRIRRPGSRSEGAQRLALGSVQSGVVWEANAQTRRWARGRFWRFLRLLRRWRASRDAQTLPDVRAWYGSPADVLREELPRQRPAPVIPPATRLGLSHGQWRVERERLYAAFLAAYADQDAHAPVTWTQPERKPLMIETTPGLMAADLHICPFDSSQLGAGGCIELWSLGTYTAPKTISGHRRAMTLYTHAVRAVASTWGLPDDQVRRLLYRQAADRQRTGQPFIAVPLPREDPHWNGRVPAHVLIAPTTRTMTRRETVPLPDATELSPARVPLLYRRHTPRKAG